MTQLLKTLGRTALFRGLSEEEAEKALSCLGTQRRCCAKGEAVLRAGDHVGSIALVLSGSVCIENNDAWGNKSVLDRLGQGQVFAETYACVPGEPMMVSVVAAERAEILFLRAAPLLDEQAPPAVQRLVRNLLSVSAQKNLILSRRMFHISAKTIRGRLQSYLSDQAARRGRQEFDIPFDRQQLADYLGVDRSALSAELGRMQREGLLRVRKNHFVLSAAKDE